MKLLATLLLLLAPACLGADAQWMLEKSTLSYHVSHPLHQIDGVSHEARGKGVCQAGQCSFLIAVPVKSFTSGDTNRDLHMMQVVRGAQYPMVVVRFSLPEDAASQPVIHADLQIQFAGQTVEYKQVAFQQTAHGAGTEITGAIPATVSDFKIDPPSLLAVPIKNEIPIKVDVTWRKM